jgi:CRP/FNR family transcriptional regulator, nitrogen fixation regulation protein
MFVMSSALSQPSHTATEHCKNIDPIRGLSPLADSTRRIFSYRRDQEIYGPTGGAKHWFCILSGAARKYVLLADGRRRIVDFLLPGDFFGFRARHEQFFAADAIVAETEVARYPVGAVETAADSTPSLARQIRELAFESMSRSQARLLILGRVTSREKVHAFLDEMAHRSFDGRANAVVLPMSRYDIADYLAVSVETVSRAVTELKRRGSIRAAGTRRFQILTDESTEQGAHRRHGSARTMSSAGNEPASAQANGEQRSSRRPLHARVRVA